MTEDIEHIDIELKTRDQIIQELIDLADADRRRQFRYGEKIRELADNDNNELLAKKSAAAAMSCTTRYAGQLLEVFDTFGWELFYPDVTWSMYRALLGTDNPHYWLQEALAHEWSVRELKMEYAKAQGKEIDEEAAGLKYVIKAKGEVNLSPGLITIKADELTEDSFEQGGKYNVDIRP